MVLLSTALADCASLVLQLETLGLFLHQLNLGEQFGADGRGLLAAGRVALDHSGDLADALGDLRNGLGVALHGLGDGANRLVGERSEERRVGKECL